MKILINTLLVTIIVLVNVCELNAADNAADKTGSSSGVKLKRGGPRPGGGRPRGSLTGVQDGVSRGQFQMYRKRKNDVLESPSDGFVYHKDQRIEVWRDKRRNILQTKYPTDNCPSGLNYGRFSYILRMVTLPNGDRLVECLDEHGKLLGVKPWIDTAGNQMEPSNSECFIIYANKVFRVKLDPNTEAAIKISLATSSENEIPQGRIAEEVNMAGYKFAVIRSSGNAIVGAELR